MNTQESIIALLQGELTDSAAVNRLLASLVGSGEGQQILLKQISLTRKLQALSAGIAPSTTADSGIIQQVAQLEAEASKSHLTQQGTNLMRRRVRSSVAIGLGMFLALLAGFGIGRATGDAANHLGDEKLAVHRSATGSSTPATKLGSDSSQASEHAIHSRSRSTVSYESDGAGRSNDNAVVKQHGELRAYGEQPRDGSGAEPLDPQLRARSLNTLTVIYPNGQTSVKAGSIIPIEWGGVADSVPVVIQYSADSGKSWELVARDVTGSGLSWKVPKSTKGGEGLMKVSEMNAGGVLPQFLQKLPNDTTLNIAGFSGDGTLLAVPDYDGEVTVWDIQRWSPVRKLTGHTRSVIQTSLSPDGTRAVSTALDGTVRLWDVSSGVELHRILGKGKVLQISWATDFSPSGDTIALGNDDGTITLWHAQTGIELLTFQAHDEAIRSLSFSRDGERLATASTDGKAGIFDVRSGSKIRIFAGHDGITNSIVVTDDGTLAITCGFDGVVKFWDVSTGRLKLAKQYFGGEKVGRIVLSADNRVLAVGGFGHDVLLVDPRSGEELISLPLDITDRRIGAWPVFRPGSQTLVVTHESHILAWKFDTRSDISDQIWSIE